MSSGCLAFTVFQVIRYFVIVLRGFETRQEVIRVCTVSLVEKDLHDSNHAIESCPVEGLAALYDGRRGSGGSIVMVGEKPRKR